MRGRNAILEDIRELYAEDEARLAGLTQQKAEIDAKISRLQETMRATELVRERVEQKPERIARTGTITEQVTNLVERILSLEGPVHRKELLARVKEQGIHFASEEKKQLNTFASYLTTDKRFESVGRGVWQLVDSDDEDTDAVEEEIDTSNGEGGVPLRLVK